MFDLDLAGNVEFPMENQSCHRGTGNQSRRPAPACGEDRRWAQAVTWGGAGPGVSSTPGGSGPV